MKSLSAVLFLTGFTLCACSDPEAVKPDINPTIEFPQATEYHGMLPLNPSDGFPVLVKVSTPLSAQHFVGSLKAHVTLIGGLGASTATAESAPLTDVTATLNSDGPNHYSAIITLNASGPGPVTVQAEIAGAVSPPLTAMMQQPVVMTSSVTATSIWSGNAPRYAICVNTSAIKGSLDLTAADTSILGHQPSLSTTLQPKPCSENEVSGSVQSHGIFILSATPPFTVQATLHGRPLTADLTGWTTDIAVSQAMIPVVGLELAASAVNPTANGTLFAIRAVASASGSHLQGLDTHFTIISSNDGDTIPSIAPESVTTDANGMATSYLVLSTGKQAVVEVAAGSAVQTIIVQG
jgi:hypothetical protein